MDPTAQQATAPSTADRGTIDGMVPVPPSLASRHRGLLDIVSARGRRLFADVADDAEALVVTDLHGRVVSCNARFEQLTGHRLQGMLGRRPGGLLQCAGTDQATVREIRSALHARQPIRCELLNCNARGQLYWTDMTIVPVLADDGRVHGFAARQCEISVALASQRLQRRRLLTHVQAEGGFSSYTWDHRSDTLIWGVGADRLLGLAPDALPKTGEAWKGLLHAEDLQRIGGHGTQLSGESPRPVTDVLRIRHPERGWVWLRVLTSTLIDRHRSTGTIVDISAEVELIKRDGDQRASAGLGSALARLGTWTLDPEPGEFVRACGFTRRLLGVQHESSFPLRTLLDQLEPADGQRLEATIAASLSTGQQFSDIVRALDDGSGHRWFRMTGRPDWNEHGQVQLIGAVQDVTREQRAKHALRVAETRLSRLAEAWPDTIVVVDRDETVRDLHKPREGNHPFGVGSRAGRSLRELLADEAYRRVLDALTRARLTSGGATTEIELPGDEGKRHYFEARVICMDRHDALLILRDTTRRRLLEDEAVRRLALYEHLSESQPQGLLRLDAQGRVVYANTAFKRLVNAQRIPQGMPDPHKRALQLALGPQAEELFAAVAESLASGASRVWEGRIVGDARIVEFRLHPEEAGSHDRRQAPGLLALARDVTEERQREQRLEMQRSLFSALHEIATGLLASGSRTELLRSIATHAAQLLGAAQCNIGLLIDEQELEMVAAIGKGPLRRGDRAGPSLATVAFRCIRERRPVIIDDYSRYPTRRPEVPEGAFHAVMEAPILFGDTCLGTLSIAHDVPGKPFSSDDVAAASTMARFAAIAIHHQDLVEQSLRALAERLQAEAAREDDQSLLRLLDESLQDVVFFRQIENAGKHHFETISAGITRMSGLEPEQIIEDGQRLWRRMDPESRSRLLALMEGPLQADTRIDTHVSFRDGAEVLHWCRIIMAVRQDASGRGLREGLIIDLSRERELQIQHENLIARLRDANADLSRFNYSVAHDLRNPVVAVMGMAQLLERELQRGKTDSAARRLQAMMRSAQHMAALLDDLLQLAKLGAHAVRKRRLKVTELVGNVVETFTNLVETTGARIEIDIDPKLEVSLDPGLMTAALVNLVSNALKFSSEGDAPWARIETRIRPDAALELKVIDRGIGIAPEHQKRVFELFERLNPGIEGSGVGLAIVQRCVQLHGGTIELESASSTGCCFTITLPQQQQDPAHERVEQQPH